MPKHHPQPPVSARKLLRLPAVRERTALSRSTLYALERAGQFPRRVQIGPRAVGWYEDEIAHWIESRCRRSA